MINTNITNFRKNIYSIIEQTIKFNEPVNVSTKSGNAVILSEEDYNDIMATLELASNSNMERKIIDGLKIDVSECVPESEVEW